MDATQTSDTRTIDITEDGAAGIAVGVLISEEYGWVLSNKDGSSVDLSTPDELCRLIANLRELNYLDSNIRAVVVRDNSDDDEDDETAFVEIRLVLTPTVMITAEQLEWTEYDSWCDADTFAELIRTVISDVTNAARSASRHFEDAFKHRADKS